MRSTTKNNSRVGLKEIAEAAHVSMVTVSSVLNGRGRISASRREEIMDLARKMGYQPSVAARILKSKKNHDVGLLIFETSDLIRQNAGFFDLMTQFIKNCREKRIRFQIESFDPCENPQDLPSLFTDGLVGGLLIAGNPEGVSRDYFENKLKLPYVRICEPGEYSVNFRILENVKAVILALLNEGYTKIALVNGTTRLSVFRNLKKGYEDAFKTAGLLPVHKLYTEHDFSESADYRKFIGEDLALVKNNQIEILIGTNGLYTKALIAALLQNGVKIPDGLQIICMETLDWEIQKFYPAISALAREYSKITSEALKMLHCRMNDLPVPNSNVLINQNMLWLDTTVKKLNDRKITFQ